ncbi:MAG TPA: hypothetical protein ENJ99_02420, partial [Rhizobiales bacterium]|nr:hypothetical protein [Hyphomicrobiales bacterium]
MADMHMTGRSGPKGLIFRLLPVVSCLMMASGQAAGGEKIELPAQKTGIQIVSAGKGDAIAELGARIVEASFRALRKDGAPVSISLTWIDDRQLHLDPLLSRKVFDMGIAWQKPQCDDSALAGRDRHLCEGFFFSKPFITVTE